MYNGGNVRLRKTKSPDPALQIPNLKQDWGRSLATVIAAVLIFGVGISVGNGRLAIGLDSLRRDAPVSKGNPKDLDYSSVEQVYDTLRASYDGQLDTQKLMDGLKSGLAQATDDPYTEYFNTGAAKDFSNDLNGSFTGIGAELGKDDQNNIQVIAPIAGFPAERAGLKPKDIIAEINGESTANLTVEKAVSKVRGPKDTKVTLKIIRGGIQALTLEITREQITIPSVTSKILDGNIGYLKIARFSEDTTDLATKAAQQFADAKVKGVVVDVRGDPGGLLEASVKIASLWLPEGKTVLQEKRDNIVTRTYRSTGPAVLNGIPTVVLIDEGSASASEILAGALKDNGAAKLLGVKTFGKGSVQSLEPLLDGSLLKVTIAKWYTPAGKNITKEGIKPDQEVKRTDEDFKNNRDPQLDAASDLLQK
jgi:carboxyl-terminal processing protease